MNPEVRQSVISGNLSARVEPKWSFFCPVLWGWIKMPHCTTQVPIYLPHGCVNMHSSCSWGCRKVASMELVGPSFSEFQQQIQVVELLLCFSYRSFLSHPASPTGRKKYSQLFFWICSTGQLRNSGCSIPFPFGLLSLSSTTQSARIFWGLSILWENDRHIDH